jgi:Mce-associated membrane protein
MSTPSPPGLARRRTTGIRRPRVAGRPAAPVPPSERRLPAPEVPVAEETSAPVEQPTPGGETNEAPPRALQPTGKRQLRRRTAPAAPAACRTRKSIPMPVLAGALALLLGAAAFFGIAATQLRATPAAHNKALVDIGTTAQVTQQVDDALKTIYSFDYTRLDQNETAARAVITPSFAGQFDELFKQVRQLAPQQQAVVTATVNLSAVKSIDGDTAVLLVFLDQQATRAQSGTQPQQLAAAGRLTVTAQLVDGTWKVADVQPH